MTKKELARTIIAEAPKFHVTVDVTEKILLREKQGFLEALLLDINPNYFQAEAPVIDAEPEPEPVTPAAADPTDWDFRIDAVLNALPIELLPETYPNLGDWIKIQVITGKGTRKTVLEARLGKKELRIQAAEAVAEAVGGNYRLVKSFSKPATYFLPYNNEGLDQMVRLGMEAREQMGL